MMRCLTTLPLIFLLSGCGIISNLGRGDEREAIGKVPEVPSQLLAGGGRATVKIEPSEQHILEMGADPGKESGIAGLPTEEELIFTNPDDVETSEAAIAGLFSAEKKNWLSSHSVAKNLALVESKPLLIVFTNSNGSSLAAAKLEKELLARTDFAGWAGEHFVRLKLDFNVKNRSSADGAKMSEAIHRKKYLDSLKSRYKVGGFPALIVVAADGSVLQHLRGYSSGSYEYTWGLLKTAVSNNGQKQEDFEKKLLQKGYRRWQGKNERKILAKLASYKDGELLLIGPNGVRYRTHEKSVSSKDRKWIADQKEKRKNL